MSHRSTLAVLLAGAAVLCNAQAQDSATLKKIKESGAITLGVRESSIPFSYLEGKQEYRGYSLDLCAKVVAAIQKQLGMSKLKVNYSLVTSSTRMPLMISGAIDLECGSTTNNVERQKQVAFSSTIFLTSTRLMAKKSSGVAGLRNLRGKTLVSTAGTANLKELAEINEAKNLGITIVTAKDHAEAFQMVESDRATAFGMDDILLASLAANARAPDDYAISRESLFAEPYALMMRRDDPGFKKVVDATLAEIYASGDIKRIYAKWFMTPIPPKGINLNWPIGEALQRNFAQPSDSGDPASYKAGGGGQ